MANFLTRVAQLIGVQKRSNAVNDPQFWVNQLFDTIQTASGVIVNPETALKVSTVYACISLRADIIASLPKAIYKRRKDGGKDLADGHYLYDHIHLKPNDEMTAFEYFEMEQFHLDLRGNTYAYKLMNGSGQIDQIIPLNPARMAVVRINGEVHYYYSYTPADDLDTTPKIWDVPDEFVWHLKGISRENTMAINTVGIAREAIGLAMTADNFAGNFFANNAVPGNVLEHPTSLKQAALENLQNSIQEYARSKRFFTLVLEEGLKWHQIAATNKDSQFLETRTWQLEEIARYWRIPLILLGHPSRTSTYASAEQFSLNFVKYTVLPLVTRWEQSINFNLLTEKERRLGYFIGFDLDGLLRGDIAARTAFYASGRQWGYLSVNDIRHELNKNPVEGGDKYISDPQNIAGKDTSVANGSASQGSDQGAVDAGAVDEGGQND